MALDPWNSTGGRPGSIHDKLPVVNAAVVAFALSVVIGFKSMIPVFPSRPTHAAINDTQRRTP